MPTRADAFNDIRTIFEWPTPPVPALRSGPFPGGTAPGSIKEWLDIFGAREWLYVAGFADVVERIPAHRPVLRTMQDPKAFLEHVKSQKTYMQEKDIPENWKKFGYTTELSRAQIGKANNAGYERLRFDKLCLSILCLDRAVRELDPRLDIFEIVSLCPVTYYLECDHAAQYFLKSGNGLEFDQLLSKFICHDPGSGVAVPATLATIPEDDQSIARRILKSAAEHSLMTYRTANIISKFLTDRAIGRAVVGSLSEQKNNLTVLHGEPILPRNGVAPLAYPKYVRVA